MFLAHYSLGTRPFVFVKYDATLVLQCKSVYIITWSEWQENLKLSIQKLCKCHELSASDAIWKLIMKWVVVTSCAHDCVA